MVELAQWQEEFRSLGVEVAAISYDSVEVLAAFHQEESLGYPLLADSNAQHVKGFGVLNEQYEEGHMAFGIPHPGVIYLSATNKVEMKFAVPGYRERPPLKEVKSLIEASLAENSNQPNEADGG